MYISFTDGFPFKIQLISSNDGGKSWSAPLVLEQTGNLCPNLMFPNSQLVAGSKVNVGLAAKYMRLGSLSCATL